MNDKEFMLMAINKAKDGIKRGQTPFGACVVKKGELVACAHNVVWENTDISAHAEISAIRQACGKLKTIDLSGCIIYSTCEPCPMCFSASHWANISKIVYGSRIEDAERLGFNELSISNSRMKTLGRSRIKIKGGFLRDECLELFALWEQQKKRRVY